MEKRIYLSPPDMDGRELEYIKKAFEDNYIAPLGPNVDLFEKEISKKVGIQDTLALNSCTSAIHLALKYLSVKEDDIVLTSTLTFIGSCNPILYEKAVPVFIDSEPDSWNMSPIALEKALECYKKEGIKPKAVIVVNLYGQSADMDPINQICEKYNVPVIEDAAESLGAEYKGRQSGTSGYIGVYSFNGNKIITTSGGGMIVSKDADVINKCRFWSMQSKEDAPYYEHKELGYNYRMSNILASIGRGQLELIDQKIEKKKQIYEKYKEAFKHIEGISMMPIPEWSSPNYWLSVIGIDSKSKKKPIELLNTLEKSNIEARPVWNPMHRQPIFKDNNYFVHGDESVSDKIFENGLCLPSGTGMSESEQDRVIDIVRDFLPG